MLGRSFVAAVFLLSTLACGRVVADKAAGSAPGAEIDRAASALVAAIAGKITAGREKTKVAVAPFAVEGDRGARLGTELACRTAQALEMKAKGKVQAIPPDVLLEKIPSDVELTDARLLDAARQSGCDIVIDAQIAVRDDVCEVMLKAQRVDDLALIAEVREKIKRSPALDEMLQQQSPGDGEGGESLDPLPEVGSDAEIKKGDEAYRNADYEKALAHYLKVVDATDKAGVIYRTAFILQNERKDYARAQQYYEKLIEQRPGMAEAHNNLGNVLRARGNLQGAVKQLHEAIRLAPQNAAAHYNLGLVYYEMGKPQEALEQFRRAGELDPSNAAAFNNQGEILLESGDIAGARAAFEKTLKLKPSHLNAATRLTEIALEGGDIDAAGRIIKDALGRNPLDADLVFLSARQKLCRGKVDDAVREYQKLVDAFRATPQVNSLQALALARRGDFQKAHELLDKAAAERDGLRLVCEVRPAVFFAEGRDEDALKAAAEACAVQPAIPLAPWRKCLLTFIVSGNKEGKEAARRAYAASGDEHEKFLLLCLMEGKAPQRKQPLDQAETCRMNLALAVSALAADDTAAAARLKDCLKTTAADSPDYLIALILNARLESSGAPGKQGGEK